MDGANGVKLPANPVWIGSTDFHMICALAGFDGVAVAERLRR
jgi:hypothetical protein